MSALTTCSPHSSTFSKHQSLLLSFFPSFFSSSNCCYNFFISSLTQTNSCNGLLFLEMKQKTVWLTAVARVFFWYLLIALLYIINSSIFTLCKYIQCVLFHIIYQKYNLVMCTIWIMSPFSSEFFDSLLYTGKRNWKQSLEREVQDRTFISVIYTMSLAHSRDELRSAKQMPLLLQLIIVAIKTNLEISLRSLFSSNQLYQLF